MGAGLLVAIWWDLRTRRVPNSVNASLALSGVLAQICLPSAPGLWSAVSGALLAAVLLLVPFRLGVYRGGDVKLMMAAGVWVGAATAPWMVLLGVAFGGIVALGLLLARPAVRSMIYSDGVPPPERPNAAHVPMALAFGAGAVVAIWVSPPWVS